MLEGQCAAALGQQWRINVYGIHERAGRRWVQLSVAGRPGQLLTVAMAPSDTIQHVLLAIATWIAGGVGANEARHVA